MLTYYDQVREAADAIRARVPDVPRVAIVLGSGLGDFAAGLSGAISMPYRDLPHWPGSGVIGHEGRLVVGGVRGRTIAVLAGRCHVYEGHDLRTVSFAVRAVGLLGVKTLILTNAAGGVNTGFAPGALMVIDDHLNLIGGNPLVGANDDRFGPRFPDMTEVYSSRLRVIADQSGREIGMTLPHGVYAAVLGPSYVSSDEIRFVI
jgi:purine-nucleoside phosphorylase